MHGYAVALVLFSAILHTTWNAQLKGTSDRAQFMVNMCLAVGGLSLICVPFLPWPSMSSWTCIGISAVLHFVYNLLLLQNYKRSDLGSAYAIARGVSASLVCFFVCKSDIRALGACVEITPVQFSAPEEKTKL